MNRSAVLHIPMSRFAFAAAEDTFIIRLRTAKGDVERCTLFWGDRACVDSPVRFAKIDMKRRYQDELYDFYEAALAPCPVRICYYFELEKGEERIYYYADAFHDDLPDLLMPDGFVVEGRSEYYQYPYILRSEIQHLPQWFQEAVVYNIFPDSFADGKCSLPGASGEISWTDGRVSKNRLGGTIRGILENLDYISSLGFNCLYLNPIFTAGEYHKYDVLDYFHVDPCMGTDEDFRELVEAVHTRGMHIIIDGVFNHCSWYFPLFSDVVERGEASPYREWFYDLTFPVQRPDSEEEIPKYACFAYERKMPKLNTSNLQVQEYFSGVGRYWVQEFQVDGWRLDVANEVDKNFWRSFRNAVKSVNPDAVLIGEVWENAEVWLKGDMLDSVMNYDFRKHCRDFFALRKTKADSFAWGMTDMFLRYPIQISYGQLNLLDSHDVPRFYSLCGEDYQRWQMAFLYLCMAPGVPSVFYGDERRISGVRENEYRRGMPWEQEQSQTQQFVRKVIEIRKKWIEPCAEWHIVTADAEENLLVFDRSAKYRVRILIHQGDRETDARSYIAGGKILLQERADHFCLGKNGFVICLFE